MSAVAPTDLPDRIAGLRAELDRHAESLSDPPPRGEPDARVAALLALLGRYDDREAYRALEADGSVARYRAVFAPRLLGFVAAVERRAAAELAAAGPGETDRMLTENEWGAYAPMARMLASVDLTRVRRVAMVGVGTLPDSLIYLRRHTSGELVGFDRDPTALASARAVVARLGLERLAVRAGDGSELDYGGYDLICPSVFAAPRRAVIARIATTADPGATVILRDPVGTGTLLFERCADALPAPLEIRTRPPSPPGRLMLRRYLVGVGAAERR